MKWYYHVSHPLLTAPAAVPEYTNHVPPYEEFIVEQQWARHPSDLLQIIKNIRGIVDSAVVGIPHLYSNPIVARVMETIRQQYRVLEEVPLRGGGFGVIVHRCNRFFFHDFCTFVVLL